MHNSTSLLVDSIDKETPVIILIIDDNLADRLLYKTWLEKHSEKNYHVIEAANALDGYDAFIEHRPAIILLDFYMPSMNGLELLWEMKQSAVTLPPVIVITGSHHEDIKTEAMKKGAYAYLNKKELTQHSLAFLILDALRSKR